MTLLELLVKILPDIGGFPEDCIFAAYRGGYVKYYVERDEFMMPNPLHLTQVSVVPDDYNSAIVTSAQYQSALAASQKVEWDGVGMPPVGCECEYQWAGYAWKKGKVCYISKQTVLILEIFDGDESESAFGIDDIKFRPLSTEADKKRDKVISNLAFYVGVKDCEDLYDAISAGKIPGVKLED